MDQLSTELELRICSFLDITSLKSLRLVEKRRSVAPAEFLFEDVYTTLIPEYLDRLKGLANHPLFAKYVKTVTYMTDLVHHDSWNDIRASKARLREWQKDMIRTCRDEKEMGACFEKFVNVKAFMAVGAFQLSQKFRAHGILRSSHLSIPILASMEHLLGDKCGEIYELDPMERTFSVRALPLTFPALESLHLGCVLDYDYDYDYPIDFEWGQITADDDEDNHTDGSEQNWSIRQSNFTPKFRNALSKLRNLTVMHQTNEPRYMTLSVDLSAMLNHCSHLQSLTINGCYPEHFGFYPEDEDHRSIDVILAGTTMPSLKIFTITRCTMEAAQLSAFLQRHAHLENITFDAVALTDEHLQTDTDRYDELDPDERLRYVRVLQAEILWGEVAKTLPRLDYLRTLSLQGLIDKYIYNDLRHLHFYDEWPLQVLDKELRQPEPWTSALNDYLTNKARGEASERAPQFVDTFAEFSEEYERLTERSKEYEGLM